MTPRKGDVLQPLRRQSGPRHPPQTPFVGTLGVVEGQRVYQARQQTRSQANVLLKKRILNNDRFVGIGRQLSVMTQGIPAPVAHP